MPAQNQDPKPKPAAKSDLLLDVALEAQYFRTSSLGVPLVLIPNHPTQKAPTALLDNYEFVSWLTWRCYRKHGFLASSALINAALRFLTGLAMYDESTPVWDTETKQVAKPPSLQPRVLTMPPTSILVAKPASIPPPVGSSSLCFVGQT